MPSGESNESGYGILASKDGSPSMAQKALLFVFPVMWFGMFDWGGCTAKVQVAAGRSFRATDLDKEMASGPQGAQTFIEQNFAAKLA